MWKRLLASIVYKKNICETKAADTCKGLRFVLVDVLCRLGCGLLNWSVSAVCHRPASVLQKDIENAAKT